MVIASRTPEGAPNQCPVCGHRLRLEPPRPTLDAPCPHCGHLLWFEEDEPPSADRRRLAAEMILMIATERFGPLGPDARAAIESRAANAERLQALVERAFRCR